MFKFKLEPRSIQNFSSYTNCLPSCRLQIAHPCQITVGYLEKPAESPKKTRLLVVRRTKLTFKQVPDIAILKENWTSRLPTVWFSPEFFNILLYCLQSETSSSINPRRYVSNKTIATLSLLPSQGIL